MFLPINEKYIKEFTGIELDDVDVPEEIDDFEDIAIDDNKFWHQSYLFEPDPADMDDDYDEFECKQYRTYDDANENDVDDFDAYYNSLHRNSSNREERERAKLGPEMTADNARLISQAADDAFGVTDDEDPFGESVKQIELPIIEGCTLTVTDDKEDNNYKLFDEAKKKAKRKLPIRKGYKKSCGCC